MQLLYVLYKENRLKVILMYGGVICNIYQRGLSCDFEITLKNGNTDGRGRIM